MNRRLLPVKILFSYRYNAFEVKRGDYAPFTKHGVNRMNKFMVACVCCLAINCSSYFTAMDIYKKTTIDKIDIHQVKDGTYVGYYDMILVNALVRATVKDGVLTKLDLLEHGYDKKHDGSAVIQQILKK
jgi:uncharacterized protein with FMN-binding domain